MKAVIIKQVPVKKIYAVGVPVGEYDLEKIARINFDLFVYSYERGSYDGSGFAIWRVGGKWFYHELGHCSCYGPFERIDLSKNVGMKFKDIARIANTHYTEHGKKVLAGIKEILKPKKKIKKINKN